MLSSVTTAGRSGKILPVELLKELGAFMEKEHVMMAGLVEKIESKVVEKIKSKVVKDSMSTKVVDRDVLERILPEARVHVPEAQGVQPTSHQVRAG